MPVEPGGCNISAANSILYGCWKSYGCWKRLQKSAPMPGLLSVGRRYLPRPLIVGYAEFTILRLPDRVFMTKRIVPSLISLRPDRLLNVGVHHYTYRMQQTLVAAGIDVYTADIDPRETRWGVQHRHRVCNAIEIDHHFPAQYFDVVILNGMLGYGIDTAGDFDRAIHAIATVMRPGGVLILGWDDNMFADPFGLNTYEDLFARNSALLGVDRVKHHNGLRDPAGREAFKVYDVLTRR